MNALLSPCAKCPFRKDSLAGWLGSERMQEICSDTVTGNRYFVCHETYHKPLMERRLCAGKLILEERENKYGNKSTRLAIAFDFFSDYVDLKNKHLIFDSVNDAVKHHS